MLKRYILFAGLNYYPAGGWNDMNLSFDATEEVLLENPELPLKIKDFDWHHVIDTHTGERVCWTIGDYFVRS